MAGVIRAVKSTAPEASQYLSGRLIKTFKLCHNPAILEGPFQAQLKASATWFHDSQNGCLEKSVRNPLYLKVKKAIFSAHFSVNHIHRGDWKGCPQPPGSMLLRLAEHIQRCCLWCCSDIFFNDGGSQGSFDQWASIQQRKRWKPV